MSTREMTAVGSFFKEKNQANVCFRHLKNFTLVELLVVIAIISVLAGMLLPVLQEARDAALQIKCVSRIKQGSVVFAMYFSDYNSYIPPLAGATNKPWGYNYGSWYECVSSYTSRSTITANFDWTIEKPMELVCPSSPESQQIASPNFPYYRYGMIWDLRYRTLGNPTTSYGVFQLQKPASTGLLMCSSVWADVFAYNNSVLPQNVLGTYMGSYWATEIHNSKGMSASYFDGHAQFMSVNKNALAAGVYPDIPITHATFWGQKLDGTYLNSSWVYKP